MSLDFVAVDVETANSQRGSVCAVGVAEVENGQIVRTQNWLCRPPAILDSFDGTNTSIRGIRSADVTDQPSFEECLARLVDTVGGRPVMAHNAAFDIGAIRQGCDAAGLEWPELTYGCSMVLSRRILSLISYRLPIVCSELGIPLTDHHHAGADAAAAARVVVALAQRQAASSVEDLAVGVRVQLGHLAPSGWHGCVGRSTSTNGGVKPATPAANEHADPNHPLYGQVMVLTGTLSMRRYDARAAVAELGATPEMSVNKRTTMLVIGDGFTANSVEDSHTSKAESALKWQTKGHRIEILTEGDFLELLEHEGSSGRGR